MRAILRARPAGVRGALRARRPRARSRAPRARARRRAGQRARRDLPSARAISQSANHHVLRQQRPVHVGADVAPRGALDAAAPVVAVAAQHAAERRLPVGEQRAPAVVLEAREHALARAGESRRSRPRSRRCRSGAGPPRAPCARRAGRRPRSSRRPARRSARAAGSRRTRRARPRRARRGVQRRRLVLDQVLARTAAGRDPGRRRCSRGRARRAAARRGRSRAARSRSRASAQRRSSISRLPRSA